jgi:hypothetical protein
VPATSASTDILPSHHLLAGVAAAAAATASTAGPVLLSDNINNCDADAEEQSSGDNDVIKTNMKALAVDQSVNNLVELNSVAESSLDMEPGCHSDEAKSVTGTVDSAGEEAVRFKRLKLSHRSYRSHTEVAAADSPDEVPEEEDEDMRAAASITSCLPQSEVRIHGTNLGVS